MTYIFHINHQYSLGWMLSKRFTHSGPRVRTQSVCSLTVRRPPTKIDFILMELIETICWINKYRAVIVPKIHIRDRNRMPGPNNKQHDAIVAPSYPFPFRSTNTPLQRKTKHTPVMWIHRNSLASSAFIYRDAQ